MATRKLGIYRVWVRHLDIWTGDDLTSYAVLRSRTALEAFRAFDALLDRTGGRELVGSERVVEPFRVRRQRDLPCGSDELRFVTPPEGTRVPALS